MATYTAAYADCRWNDNTRFRTQGKWISDQLQTMGWTKTADTTQIDWTTVTAPAGADASQGWEMRVSSENLYMKIEYGSGYGAYAKSLWVTFGLGSDGSGNITGALMARQQVRTACAYSGGSAVAGDDFMSGDATRMMIALTDDPNPTYGGGLVLQRTTDAAYTERTNGTWWVLVWSYPSSPYTYAFHLGALAGFSTSAQKFGIVRLPRAVGDSSHIPVSPLYMSDALVGHVPFRDAMAAQTALVTHQSTMTIGGRTYVCPIAGGTAAAFWSHALQHNHSLLVRYD